MSRVWIAVPALLLAACGGGGGASGGGNTGNGDNTGKGGGGDKVAPAADPNAEYAALEHGADWASLPKMNTEKFWSKPHGSRMVEVYVNDVGVEAFQDKSREMAFPVGTVIVKTSWETKDKVATDVPGPVFVMVKKEAGFDPDNEDWWYALHWENVPDSWQSRMGGTQTYWRSPSAKVNYCGSCHQKFPRHVGGVPKKFRSWDAQ
jgi:hypothetical protein